jgi:arylsulfatase A-like enzyme
MNAISIVIDRWQASFAGCYGNSGIVTPEIDRLACEGFVFDQAFIDSPTLATTYRAYWHGLPALAPADAVAGPSLARRLAAAGVWTALLTDDADVAAYPESADFGEVVALPPGEAVVADDVEGTRLSRLFAAAIDWLAEAPRPFLLWIHAEGIERVWDAPLDLRRRYADEDAPVYEGATAPHLLLPDDFDPDERLAFRWAYAGQVSLLDQCLGTLVDLLASSGLDRSTVLSVLSARGYPLGEHRQIGDGPASEVTGTSMLHEELIHVPWLLRMADGAGQGGRTQALVQPADVGATLADALGQAIEPAWTSQSALPLIRDQVESLRDRACIVGRGGQRAIRTPAWHLTWQDAAAELDKRLELYVKPDDRWEVNDVADRRGDLLEPLEQAFDDARQAIVQGTTPAPLQTEMLVGPE